MLLVATCPFSDCIGVGVTLVQLYHDIYIYAKLKYFVVSRYDSSKTFSQNVDLTDPILSRFDILCVVKVCQKNNLILNLNPAFLLNYILTVTSIYEGCGRSYYR